MFVVCTVEHVCSIIYSIYYSIYSDVCLFYNCAVSLTKTRLAGLVALVCWLSAVRVRCCVLSMICCYVCCCRCCNHTQSLHCARSRNKSPCASCIVVGGVGHDAGTRETRAQTQTQHKTTQPSTVVVAVPTNDTHTAIQNTQQQQQQPSPSRPTKPLKT